MARLPRLSLAGHLHHVVQRGNNRQPIFATEADRRALLGWMADYAREEEVAIHAYVLMDNHFHVLATPAGTQGLPRMMQAIGRRYVRHYNQATGRSGTLWEGRYRSTVVEPGAFLLALMAYLDLNPVRAGVVQDPADYLWSSYGHYAGLRQERWLTPHALYWGLGNTPFAREAAYAELVHAGLPEGLDAAFTASVLSGWALGHPGFLDALQGTTERRVTKSRPGRPAKKPI